MKTKMWFTIVPQMNLNGRERIIEVRINTNVAVNYKKPSDYYQTFAPPNMLVVGWSRVAPATDYSNVN